MHTDTFDSLDAATTIQDFHALLHSDSESDPLLDALRVLTTIEQPEDVVEAIGPMPEGSGFGWD